MRMSPPARGIAPRPHHPLPTRIASYAGWITELEVGGADNTTTFAMLRGASAGRACGLGSTGLHGWRG